MLRIETGTNVTARVTPRCTKQIDKQQVINALENCGLFVKGVGKKNGMILTGGCKYLRETDSLIFKLDILSDVRTVEVKYDSIVSCAVFDDGISVMLNDMSWISGITAEKYDCPGVDVRRLVFNDSRILSRNADVVVVHFERIKMTWEQIKDLRENYLCPVEFSPESACDAMTLAYIRKDGVVKAGWWNIPKERFEKEPVTLLSRSALDFI